MVKVAKRGTVSVYTGNVKCGIKLSKGKALTNYIEANAAARACFFTDISSSTMFPTASIIKAGFLMLAWVMLWPRESSRRIRSYQPKLCITYVDFGLMDIKNGNLPEKVKRNTKTRRARVNKRILGRSIDERSPRIESRKDFGHWECDLVLGHKTKDDDVFANERRVSPS